MKDDCIFCKIVKGTAPSLKIYDDENTYVFLDISNDVDGHMIAIPKAHIHNIIDCSEETLGQLMSTVKRIANHLADHCGYDGVNLLNASDESAGQSVPHFHIHIIPRKKGDGIDAWPKFTGGTAAREAMQARLKMR